MPRARLIGRLDEGLRWGYRLTLICAPAGSGKMTLLSEWAAGAGRRDGRRHTEPKVPIAWLSLDGEDNDPVRFLTCLLGALREIDPGVALRPSSCYRRSSFLRQHCSPSAHQPARCPTRYLHSRTRRLPPDRDPGHSPAVGFPPGAPATPSALGHRHPWGPARAQIVELRQADLSFTEEELVDFLRRVMGLDLSPGDIATPGRRTEGLDRRPTTGRKFAPDILGSHRYVLDYHQGRW